MQELYFDNAASTPIHPSVLETYIDASRKYWGNCSNLRHSYGKEAKQALERSREKIGNLLGLPPNGIIFTSGATEANNLALRGITCLQKRNCNLIISSIEHACVEESTKFLVNRGVKIHKILTKPSGQIDLDHLKYIISRTKPDLISVMLVNNETGVIQPLEEVISLARKYDTLVHTDAVQAIGKMPLNILTKVDMVSLNAHKIHGLKGIGCLWIRPNLKISPLLVGGGQEFGIRAGTTDVPAAVAFSKALEISIKDDSWLNPIRHSMNYMELQLKKIPGVLINGESAPRTGVITNISFPFNNLVIDRLKNIAASTASACSCNIPTPSRVLTSIGLSPTYAKNVVRLSAGRYTTPEEITLATRYILLAVENIK